MLDAIMTVFDVTQRVPLRNRHQIIYNRSSGRLIANLPTRTMGARPLNYTRGVCDYRDYFALVLV